MGYVQKFDTQGTAGSDFLRCCQLKLHYTQVKTPCIEKNADIGGVTHGERNILSLAQGVAAQLYYSVARIDSITSG
jgi:hypothetical protein